MPIKITTAEISELETLLGQHRYYSALLAGPLLGNAGYISLFAAPAVEKDDDELNVDEITEHDEDEEDEDDEGDDDDGSITLPDLDDDERKKLDDAMRSVLRRRLAKIVIELKKFGVDVEG